MFFHTQIASIMEVLANAAVAEICKLVDDDYAVFRLEITQSQKENRTLRRKLQLLELKVVRERAERTIRERVRASRPCSVKILDQYKGMARGEGHLTGGHMISVKPAGHNTWRDDQPITVDEGSGSSTQHVIVIESADAEASGGSSLVKQDRTEGEDLRDIQTRAAAGVAPPVATEDLATTPHPRTRRSITEVLNSNDQGAKVLGGGATTGSSKEKRFLCMFCNKGFSCLQKVEIHQRVHTGVKPFSCTQCHMRFTEAGKLKRHQRVHTGEKPFSCTQCQMRFAQAGHLKRHQRVHTGEKPYSCPQCQMCFAQASNLKMHLKVHTGERPFACTHCGKKFSERSYLRIHQQKNHSTL
ncbi:uncharacterized protein [Salvelinus alpinus]|uniref:uncharacterized protein isoform X3 n=1 Tax=Salvelinus alpinus TaxID=8036 RepID=UPI0039FD3AC0